MAIVAGFFVYKFAQYIHAIANGGTAVQHTTPLPTADEDSDHDGLSNQQEVIWNTDPFNPDTDGDGFKDGEEVNSGHSPLVPGPDDLINADNLTQQFSDLAASGLLAGDLQPDSPNYAQSLEDITSGVTDSAAYLFNQQVNPDSLSVINPDQETNQHYADEVVKLLGRFTETAKTQYAKNADNLKLIGSSGFANSEIKNFYSSQQSIYSDILNQGMTLRVPRPFLNNHADFLTLVQQMQYISQSIASGDTDPIKAALAFDALRNTYDNLLSVLISFDQIMSDQHVKFSTHD